MSHHEKPEPDPAPSRRSILGTAAALPLAAAFGGLASLPARAESGAVRGHNPDLLPSRDVLGSWFKQLHAFGPVRHTGSAPCRAYEEWLAKSFADLGCKIERDQFRLTSWEANITDCDISVQEEGGATRKLDVVGYYPFSASTMGKAPVSGKVLYAGIGDAAAIKFIESQSPAALAESIIIIDMPIRAFASDKDLKTYGPTYPAQLPPLVAAPHSAAGYRNGKDAMAALENKCRGMILCYTDTAKEAVRHNFTPFTDTHRKIPALWVGADDSAYLRKVSGKATATMRLGAKLTPDARADTILATLPGASPEVVLMTTQTDGPNECNENGSLGLLAAATYLSKVKNRRRTFVFSLPTGHYAGGPIKETVTGSGRDAGTRGMAAKWPDMYKRAVAQIALEQMGAMEWADIDGKWAPTGRPAQQHWLPTPATAAASNRLFMAAAAGADPKFVRADLVESGFSGGEGGSLRADGIPGIGLMGWPHYFFRADPAGVLDKLSPDVMFNQVLIVTKMLTLMDSLTPDQLKGKAPITDAEIFGA